MVVGCYEEQKPSLLCAYLVFFFALVMQALLGAVRADSDNNIVDAIKQPPSWLTLGASHRTRYEVVDSRLLVPNDQDQLFLRTTLSAEARFSPVRFGFELMDSRSHNPPFGEPEHPLGTFLAAEPVDAVLFDNAFEPVQLYLGLIADNFVETGAQLDIIAGRFTMNLGSGRLVGRDEFNNSVRSFYGAKANWTRPNGDELNLFYTLPSQEPDRTTNDVAFDTPNDELRFWGAHYAKSNLAFDTAGELFVYGLNTPKFSKGLQDRGLDRSFSSRDFFFFSPEDRTFTITPGMRVSRAPKPGRIDFDIEGAVQVNINRAAKFNIDYLYYYGFDTIGHGKNGFFTHADFGYTFDGKLNTRIAALFDIASGAGERGPVRLGDRTLVVENSDSSAAFDPLFGVEEKDFGPGGLFDLFERSDVLTAGAKIEFDHSRRLKGSLRYLAVWNENQAGLGRPFGAFSDLDLRRNGVRSRFVGHQIDVNTSFELVENFLSIDVGFATFIAGPLPPAASGIFPDFSRIRNPFYGYSSISFHL